MVMKSWKPDYFSPMCFNKLRILVGVVSTVTIMSCSPALYKPLPEHATASITHTELLKGRELYVNACGSCHSLYLPHQYKEHVWKENLDEMQERSKISDSEKALIFGYLKHAPAKTADKASAP